MKETLASSLALASGMAQDGTPNQPTIPAYMVNQAYGLILATMNGASATIGDNPRYFISGNDDIVADFSGQGPTGVDFRIKPDVVAPGVNVLSSIPLSYCGGAPCFDFFQGTSMATPHLAGSAAIVRWLRPGWSAAETRSAIVNTADNGVLKGMFTGTPEMNVNIAGAGRENIAAAARASAALDPVSVSFGGIPSGSGQTQSIPVQLSNLGGTARSFSIAIGAGNSGVIYSVSPASLNLAIGATGIFTVTMSAAKGAVASGHQSTLTVSSAGSEVAHAAVFTPIK